MGRTTAWGLLALALSLLLARPGSAGEDEAGFTALFDGKTLRDWTPVATEHFTVRDGVILNEGGTGWLRSGGKYKDFVFRAEYRVVRPGSDSGVFFRASLDSTPKPPSWPVRGYQLQVIDGDSHVMIFGHGAPCKFDRNAEALKAARNVPGEWQALELKVVGTRAEVTLNGKLVTVSETIALPEGYLGLQGENGRFEWRRLRIKELPTR